MHIGIWEKSKLLLGSQKEQGQGMSPKWCVLVPSSSMVGSIDPSTIAGTVWKCMQAASTATVRGPRLPPAHSIAVVLHTCQYLR